MLCHPWMLRGQVRGEKSEVAASALPCQGPTTQSAGRKVRTGCIANGLSGAEKRAEVLRHPRILGGPKCGKENHKSHPCLQGGQKAAEVLRHPCILGRTQHQVRGAKSEAAPSPLPSQGAEKRVEMLCHLRILGGSQRQTREGKSEEALSSLPSRGSKKSGSATPLLHSRGSPTPSTGSKNRRSCLTIAFSDGQKRAEMLRHPCILGSSQRQARGKIRTAYLILAFSGAQKRVEMLRQPCILGYPKCQAQGAKSEVVRN